MATVLAVVWSSNFATKSHVCRPVVSGQDGRAGAHVAFRVVAA